MKPRNRINLDLFGCDISDESVAEFCRGLTGNKRAKNAQLRYVEISTSASMQIVGAILKSNICRIDWHVAQPTGDQVISILQNSTTIRQISVSTWYPNIDDIYAAIAKNKYIEQVEFGVFDSPNPDKVTEMICNSNSIIRVLSYRTIPFTAAQLQTISTRFEQNKKRLSTRSRIYVILGARKCGSTHTLSQNRDVLYLIAKQLKDL